FSSRRRHTRFSRDWSSDVCSSDLDGLEGGTQCRLGDECCVDVAGCKGGSHVRLRKLDEVDLGVIQTFGKENASEEDIAHGSEGRSEERRVGKEVRGGRLEED